MKTRLLYINKITITVKSVRYKLNGKIVYANIIEQNSQ